MSGVPVVSDGRLLGVVTKTDIARAVAEASEADEIVHDSKLRGIVDDETLETAPRSTGSTH